MASNVKMQSFSARLETFQPRQLTKRRPSAQGGRKRGANTVEWPHSQPSPEALSRAGFYYVPEQDILDGVKCFFCGVKLDGWEESDIPYEEHRKHSNDCKFVICVQAGMIAQEGRTDETVSPDPASDELVAARRATFEAVSIWPHETKKGWKCKIKHMVDAGWCFTPSTETGADEEPDDATCFYCGLSLDGWEPKDDPMQEHKKRSPECAFFKLTEGSRLAGAKRGKAKTKASRSSTQSKTGRASIQSVVSVVSDMPSSIDVDEMLEIASTNVDERVIPDANLVDKPIAKKGRKPSTTVKTTKGRKRAGTVDAGSEVQPIYPDLSQAHGADTGIETIGEDIRLSTGSTQTKDVDDSSAQASANVHEVDVSSRPPAKKASTQRKPRAAPKSKYQSKAAPADIIDQSEVSAQLFSELDHSVASEMDIVLEADDRTPQPAPAPSKTSRGIKRTSDGAPKHGQRNSVDSVVNIDSVEPSKLPTSKAFSKGKTAAKTKKGNPRSTTESIDTAPVAEFQAEIDEVFEPKPKTKAKKNAKRSKPSSPRPSRVSKASSTTSQLARRSSAILSEMAKTHAVLSSIHQDELEINAELTRIAAKQARNSNAVAVGLETDAIAEFEPSPSSTKRISQISNVAKHVNTIQDLERELQAEVDELPAPGQNLSNYVKTVTRPSLEKKRPKATFGITPSPSGSDKENMPSSSAHQPQPDASPSKITRVPLAPGTPNRAPQSPAKHLSNQLSTVPWKGIDLDQMLLSSPATTAVMEPSALVSRLVGVGGTLTSPEKRLTVEQWIRTQAEKGEAELRQRCEQMVLHFEREGNRAMASLEGLVTVD